MPKKTKNDITILGGGIMGLLAARALANNYAVTLYDPKGFPADNASLMAGGMLAPYSEIEHLNMDWVDAGHAGIDAWREIHSALNTDIGFLEAGSLLVAHRDDHYILERFRTHLPIALQKYHDTKNFDEQLSQRFETLLFLQNEAHLDPVKAMRALCNDLQKQIHLEPHALEPKDSKATFVIDCRGMSSNDTDLRGVKGEILLVRNLEFSLERPVRLMHPRYPLYILPRGDNVFMIGATQIESSGDTNVSIRSAMELMSALYALHPSFGEAEILDMKAGIRPSYPDNLPRITINGNLIACNGLFRHGYLLSPVMAQCVADHMAGNEHPMMHLFLKGEPHENNHQRAA